MKIAQTMTAKSVDGGLPSPSRQKTAGATLYLMEELGDARLRCDQLMRYLAEAVQLIEQSSHRDHFFEVAGHLIQNVPDVAFKLQKALQAVALAADRIDYEELKQELRPEKVDELERVLKEVRIRPVYRKSFPPMQGGAGVNMKPKQAADKLREIAKTAREEGSLPLHDIAALIGQLDPARTASTEVPAADTLEKLATMLETSKEPMSRRQLGTLLSRIAMESEFNAAYRRANQQRLTQDVLQLGNVEEVKKKFKAENPDLSDADLAEIGKQWEKNKDVVKGKTALAADPMLAGLFENIKGLGVDASRAANVGRWRPAVWALFKIVDEIGTILVRLGSEDTQKSEAMKREIRQVLPSIDRRVEEELQMGVLASDDEDKRSRFEEGKPADPTENMDKADAAKWKTEHDKNKDKFKAAAASGKRIDDSDADSVTGPILRALKTAFKAGGDTKGVTKDEAKSEVDEAVNELRDLLKRFERMPPNPLPMLDGVATNLWQLTYYLGVHKSGEGARQASDDDKLSRYEKGKPADPTENMDEDAAQQWKENTDTYGDKFKAASSGGKPSRVEAWKA